ncbi:MAG: hypothetical protein GY845_00925 [Planctomycetes bacterium]|nr:hypothetical protein [Planctomycetota bacterium]
MTRDPEKVRKELRRRVLAGYLPKYELESCIDHDCDWTVITEEEFNEIKELALADRDKLISKKAIEKEIHKAKVSFWRALKWFIPICVAIGLVYFGWVLSHLILLPERNQSDIKHIQREIMELSSEIKIIQLEQHDIVQKVVVMETKIAYFGRDGEKHKERVLQVNDIMKPNENMHSDVEDLTKRIDKMDWQIKSLSQKTNKQLGGN